MSPHSQSARPVRTRLTAAVLLAATGLAVAAPTTAPADGPVVVVVKKKPTSQPADLTAQVRELAAKIRKANEDGGGNAGVDEPPVDVHVAPAAPAAAAAGTVAVFDLSTPVVEKAGGFNLLAGGAEGATTLRSLVDRLHKAAVDRDVRAVLVTLGDPGTNLAQSQEVRDALLACRGAGKRVFVYADGYDTDTYTIATGASDVCVLPGGEVMLPGVGIETMYLKGLFDKLGVRADYVQIGAYKGADEEYTRAGPSKEFAGQIDHLIDGLYDQVVTGIAANRSLPAEQVKAAIDESIMTAPAAKDRGFVDHLVDRDGLKDLIAAELGGAGKRPTFADDYASPAKEELDLSSPFALFAMLAKKPAAASGKPAVAVVFADGVIVDGGGGQGFTGGETIGSDDVRAAMREIASDPSIKAVVIRINSPGGSALASEAMWQAVRRVAKDKPVVISVGNMAASGGYYLACAGDHIFADPSAIVGSIGVVGGKFVTHDLYDKLGLTTQQFMRGRNADLFSSDTPFTDGQRRMVRAWMTQTYDQFTQRVMTTRGGKIAKIEDVAQGRVFIAGQAKELGMVDEIGGEDKAIAYAADKADLKAEGYDVRVVPAPKSLADMLTGIGGLSTASPLRPHVELAADSVLKVMPPDVRAMVGEQMEILQLLQKRPVVLAAPFVVRER